MRIRLILRTGDPFGAGPALFAQAVLPQHPRWGALLISIFTHLAAVFLAIVLSEHMLWFRDDPVDWSAYKLEIIRLRVPGRIYYRAGPPPGRRAERPKSDRHVPEASPSDVARRVAAARRLEFPAAPNSSPTAAVILQPDFRIQLPSSTSPVPPLAFWENSAHRRPPERRVILPGRQEPAPPVLSAPPVLAVPNREPGVGDINLASAPALPSPVLPLRPSSTIPLRLRDSTAEPRSGSMSASEGDAANVISVSGESPPANGIVSLAQGLRNLPLSGDGDGTPAAEKQPHREPDNPGQTAAYNVAGPLSAPVAESGAAPGRRAPDPSGPGEGYAGGPHTQSAPDVRGGDFRAASAGGKSTGAEVTRIAHPVNAVFDVIVMQSSPGEELPEAAGILTGSPVYTVFLNAGTEREWLLRFCAPARATARSSKYEVNVDDASHVSPPYPISTVIPNSVLGLRWSRHILLHGYLTANGRLRDMIPTDRGSAPGRQIGELLGNWLFRPAVKDNQPIEVEVLLDVPPQV